ncbi:MAG: PEP-CTERM sorting domain-containing protein [Candidatus Eisenbacteria bacterium]|nr:PEP-CTERM sorting domain-containing protein [Candidatus Eisenbacteria bacterium]
MTLRFIRIAPIAATAIALILISLSSPAHAFLVSPGFEQGPDVAEVSFSGTDAAGLGWFASNTDGERFKSTGPKPAAEGLFYASLLQNAGMYNGAALGIGNFGLSGFDRIYSSFAVTPGTAYDVSFLHAGDDRFGYLAGTSVVEVVDADANSTLGQFFFATPGLFNWQSAGFQFSSGAATSHVALAFTVMGANNTSGVFDAITVSPSGVVPEPPSLLLVGLGALGLLALRARPGSHSN